ncbi:hypothetical protein HDC92_004294 [Pedobacter sp. AK017]|uniref:hypothetical protein n=1 Tax=Pedobacter sp. AK017 TaxID=2723073 RepID=UPI00161A0455|nr:hypothetical protein [Pedobacter sp. AK017]MBB5440591.1 hypothetical protein [Pedobacter sp. AK017]
MEITLENLKLKFAILENSVRTWHSQYLSLLQPWDEEKTVRQLQTVYQLTHEALCIIHSLDRICFSPYNEEGYEGENLSAAALSKEISDIKLCWACSHMLSWRELTQNEKSALISFEQIYQYVNAYCFRADLRNVNTVTEDYLKGFE